MSFDWTDYLKLSKELLNSNEEAYLRSSISRAYYGVFCIARNEKGFNKATRDVHYTVINAYKKSNIPTDKKIGKDLDELRRARNESDYDGNRIVKKGFAERMIFLASDVLRRLEE